MDAAGSPISAATAAAAGLRTALAIPVASGDRVLAVLTLFTDVLEDPQDSLVALLSGIAAHVGQFIERRRIKPARIDRNARLGSASEQAIDGLVGRFAEQVPERDIYRADCCHGDALTAVGHRLAIHVLPQEFGFPGVGAEKNRLEVQIHNLFRYLRREGGITDSNEGIVGEDFEDEPSVKSERAHG